MPSSVQQGHSFRCFLTSRPLANKRSGQFLSLLAVTLKTKWFSMLCPLTGTRDRVQNRRYFYIILQVLQVKNVILTDYVIWMFSATSKVRISGMITYLIEFAYTLHIRVIASFIIILFNSKNALLVHIICRENCNAETFFNIWLNVRVFRFLIGSN